MSTPINPTLPRTAPDPSLPYNIPQFGATPNVPSPYSSGAYDGTFDPALPAASPAGGGTINSALKFLGTPGGAAVTNLVGGGLSAYGAYQQNQQNLQQEATKFAANSAQNQFNNDRADQAQRAAGVLNADPLGADQSYAQKQAISDAILPNLRNFHSQPGDSGVAAAMGGNRGGIMNALPANGFNPEMVHAMFGPGATQAAIVQRHQEINSLDPHAARPNLSAMYGDSAAPYQAQMEGWASQLQTADAKTRAAYDQQMKGYIAHMVEQESAQHNSDGFWHKFARVAAIVGAAAATIMTAGAAAPLTGLALAGNIGLGAGSAALGAWGAGSNPLAAAVAGGAGSYAGNRMKPTGGS